MITIQLTSRRQLSYVLIVFPKNFFNNPSIRGVKYRHIVAVEFFKLMMWCSEQVTSLSLAISSVLLMPLDAASRNSPWGGLPMEAIWIELFAVTSVLVVLIIPFAYFYYLTYDGDKGYA
jgi:hypothetical protein